jgi:hypothetical protein
MEPDRACVDCGAALTAVTGYVNHTGAKGHVYLNSVCRPCHARQNAVLYKLRKLHPRPPVGTLCGCCGRSRRLCMDHDHTTDEFRGWLCRQCNVSIGGLGDDLTGLRRALAYLGRDRTGL